MSQHQIEILLPHNLKELNLPMMVKNYASHARQARESGLSYEEFLLGMTEAELQSRAENRIKRRVREARFPLMKTLEAFIYEAAPELDKRLIRDLAIGQYIRERKNVILAGKSGAGKTHLALAIGHQAIETGYKVFFSTALASVESLDLAELRGELKKKINSIQKFDVIITSKENNWGNFC